MSAADKKRKGLIFVDIAVPRNVHADCKSVEGVHCYNVDDLKTVVARNTEKRSEEISSAQVILREEKKFNQWKLSQDAIPTISKLQDKAENLRAAEMKRMVNKLSKNVTERDVQLVEQLTKGIVAKLLHGPMSHLRCQKEACATHAAIDQVHRAFQLDM